MKLSLLANPWLCSLQHIHESCKTGESGPVSWMFDKAKDCVHGNGKLSKSYSEHFYVKTSVLEEYTRDIQNITMEHSGTYTCIDSAGYGLEEALWLYLVSRVSIQLVN